MHAGIDVRWVYCRGALAGAEPAACQSDRKINEIVLRLVRAKHSPPNSPEAVLGSAFAGAKGGQYATAFVPAVRELAAEWKIGFDLVLDYAIAHEVGHCLLGLSHASAGLMRSNWTGQDAREMSQLRLGISKQEAKRAAARLTKR